MNKYRAVLILTAVVLLLCLLVGCAGGGVSGVPAEQYQQVLDQLKGSQAQVDKLQGEVKKLEGQNDSVAAELKASREQIAQLQGQIGGLQEQYELVGKTPAETAENIVRYYHETHTYSVQDFYVCSDMAADVWNMLKAQGINAIIVVGNKDAAIGDILQSNHAWVLAEVAPGEYLALETTAGYTVPESENPLYYRGWSFNSPAAIKDNNRLVDEYNVRVDIIREINEEVKEVAKEHDQSTDPVTADKLKGVYDKLVEVRDKQDAELKNITAEIDGLATKL